MTKVASPISFIYNYYALSIPPTARFETKNVTNRCTISNLSGSSRKNVGVRECALVSISLKFLRKIYILLLPNE